MAAITQEKLEAAVKKAVAAERKRCIKAVKGIKPEDGEDKAVARGMKNAVKLAVAAISDDAAE